MRHYPPAAEAPRPHKPIHRPPQPSAAASTSPLAAARTPVENLADTEAQLRELREARAAMRADWDTLMAELGNPRLPTDAELERMMNSLPLAEREAMRRYHAETQELSAGFRAAPAQLPARPSDNVPNLRHFIRG